MKSLVIWQVISLKAKNQAVFLMSHVKLLGLCFLLWVLRTTVKIEQGCAFATHFLCVKEQREEDITTEKT